RRHTRSKRDWSSDRVLFRSRASPQQPAPVHRWTPVVAKPDVRIELDTATATRTDHQRRVWLRWTFPTPVPDLADVQLDRREVDRSEERRVGKECRSGGVARY